MFTPPNRIRNTKNPNLEHDTGKITDPITRFDGSWIRTSDSMILQVEAGQVHEFTTRDTLDIVVQNGTCVLDYTYELARFEDHMCVWRTLADGKSQYWVRQYPLDSQVKSVAQDFDIASTTSESTPGQRTSAISPDHLERKLKLLANVRFPELMETDFLGHHIQSVNELLAEFAFVENDKIPLYLQVGLCTKFLETLKAHSKIHQTALTVVRNRGHNWSLMTNTLLKTYCNRENLQAAYKRRLSNLQFENASKVDEFLMEAETLSSFIGQIYGSSISGMAEQRTLVLDILRKLPDFIRRDVIKAMRMEAHEEVDWEIAVPFTAAGDQADSRVSFCQIISSECRANSHSYSLSSKRGPTVTDRAMYTKQENSSDCHQWYISGELPTVTDLARMGFKDIVKHVSRKTQKAYILANNDETKEKLQTSMGCSFPKCHIDTTWRSRPLNGRGEHQN